MIATNEELALLEKWKRKLCLQEWRIKLLTHLHPEEMMVRNTTGCTEWSEAIKTARIEIINPACYGDRIVPFNFEKTLVHELLHLKFSFWCQNLAKYLTLGNATVTVAHSKTKSLLQATMNRDVVIYATPTITKDISYDTRDLVIDLGNSVPHPDRFNCPYVNRIGQLTVSVLLNRFARKEHRA